MARRPMRILAATLFALLLAGSLARADGDPASDVLLGQNVFYPYAPAVSPAIQNGLNAAATAGCRARFPVKVALIASPADLGAVPSLFGKPQSYADYLEQELSSSGKQPLLVVMATGYGSEDLPPRAQRAVASLRKPESDRSDDLARAATSAMVRLAAAGGHRITDAPAAACTDPASQVNYRNLALVIAGLIGIGICTVVAVRRTRRPTPA
ncbi:MAG: hypothetical protein JO181_00385 [Solirubrobacterales bacterium]|nr:hypothetical protein [Solirubrobacterales bacterium]